MSKVSKRGKNILSCVAYWRTSCLIFKSNDFQQIAACVLRSCAVAHLSSCNPRDNRLKFLGIKSSVDFFNCCFVFCLFKHDSDRMEPSTSLQSSVLEDDMNASSSLHIPSFNFILPSRPNTPLPLGETSYLGSAGLLDESVSLELALDDPLLSLDSTIDNIGQLEAVESSRFPADLLEPSLMLPENESLEQQLRGAICQHAHKESKGFLPLDKLNELVIEDSVSDALRECMSHLSQDDAQSYAKMICPRSQRNHMEPSFRRIFAILAMVQQPQEVFAFLENNITDNDLPLVKVQGEKKGRYELRRKFQPHRPLECLHKWSPFMIDSFEGCQWMMMSPFFSWENKRAVRTYFLADQTILPFIEDSSRDVDMEDDEDFQGGHGSIFKVKIHPAHHNFHHIAVCKKVRVH